LFYWFFEAQNNNTGAPVILWLQGGPGTSSIEVGLFNEIGPFSVNDELQLVDNPYSWNKNYHILFIDQPVGTGFSFTGSGGYVTTGQEMEDNLYRALLLFFQQYPAYTKNDFYVFGESYGGKYVPYIASYILQRGSVIPLKGVGIGDGLSDPITQVLTYAEQCFNLGLIDNNQRKELEQLQNKCAQLARGQQWAAAADARTDVLNYIGQVAGGPNLYDIRRYTPYNFTNTDQFLALPDVLKQLHVGNHTFTTNTTLVADALKNDMMQTVKGLFPNILSKVKVLLYQGQFDLRDGVASNEAWIVTIPWTGQDAFYNATRSVWNVDGSVAGYVKSFKSLTQLTLVAAGHMAPMDQPLRTQVMVSNFIENKPWSN